MNLDFYIFSQINQFATRYICLDATAIFFAQYFEYIVLFSLVLFLVKDFKKYFRMVLESFFGAVLAKEIFVDIIRQLFLRPRPFVENQIHLLIRHSATPAFPSAHASFYFALATVVYLHDKKAGTLFLLAAFLISIARVFSGVHWPSDILAGSFIGVLSAFIVNRVSKQLPKK